jgi:DNA polymerase III delta prime subunit
MSIKEFITDLDKNQKLRSYFAKPDVLKESLNQLDQMIGMRQIKTQVVKQIKTFIASKARGIYKDNDRKHCLLLGPPGCGKTTVCRILCKIWIGMGFIGHQENKSKIKGFDKLQDEIIRRQKKELKGLKDKIEAATRCVVNVSKVSNVCKRSLGVLLRNKNTIPGGDYNMLYKNISGAASVLEQSSAIANKLMVNNTKENYSMSVEAEMESTSKDPELPFYVYNRNDVVSRYVGDTSHRTTKAMNDALDGVAYFDEAYNLCNDSMGMSDTYGRDALTIINQYMDTHSDKLIVVFSGYKNDIYNNLFKVQQGLESRFTMKIEIEAYTSDDLTSIYIKELKVASIVMPDTPQLRTLIRENYNIFKFFGRDMNTLAMYTKNVLADSSYENVLKGLPQDNVVSDLDVVRKSIEIFRENIIKDVQERSTTLDDLLHRVRA